MAYETVRNLVVAVVGKDRLIADISRQDCRTVLETLQKLPPNYEKRWPDSPPQEAIELAKTYTVPPMSAATRRDAGNGRPEWAGRPKPGEV